MKRIALVLTMALAGLIGAPASAQSPGPGEDRAAPAAKTTPAERAAANQARTAVGKTVAKTATGADDQPATTAARTKLSAVEKQALRAKRKAAGVEAVKATKDKAGPN